ncbi:MAG: alpha/beta hydrolase fold domain-containing protein [Anaerohalosphaera sp.]|nr:alpha/beta hydrolase fold domain-containing protein [Anaerohalosphaera sp.]
MKHITKIQSPAVIIVLILAVCAQTQAGDPKVSLPELVGKSFSYQEINGIGLEEGVTRRDPSDVIKVGDTYYVYYTKVTHNELPKEFMPLKASGYVGTVWYATSKDKGLTWTEKGQALGLGKKGTFDSFATFTPNIVKFDNKYYLYYTGVKPTTAKKFFFENNSDTDPATIGVAVSDSPDGPFKRVSNEPVLKVSPKSKDKNIPSAFDSYRIDDAALLVRDYDGDGDMDVWLYYKGRNIDHGRGGPGSTKMGLAIADSPEKEHIRYNNGKPILANSHEVIIWPHRQGVATYASMTRTLEYAPDGKDFTTKPLKAVANPKPVAPGCFRPDLTNPAQYGKGITWGIAMKNPGGPNPYLIRYEIDLAAPARISGEQIEKASSLDINPQLQVYKTIGSKKYNLHIFRSADTNTNEKAPAIVFFFGGGWTGGSVKQFFPHCKYFASRGMVAISAEYRVKSRDNTTPFDAVEDAKSAIRYVRANANKLGIDPDKIVAAGGSAGGHLAACTGTIKQLDAKNENLTISSVPNAMVLFNPVADTSRIGYGNEKLRER